jgi:predicted nucleic acid-binding protein
VILDASAAVEMLRADTTVVPAHFDAEVYRALRRLGRRGAMDADGLRAAINALATLAVERIPLPPLLQSANDLGDRFSPPDSLYVALARALDAQLITSDAPLARACSGIARVRLV